MSVAIRFNQIFLNAAADDAGVINGVNQGFGYASHLKKNHGIDVAGKKNLSTENFNGVFDNDFIDIPLNDSDFFQANMAGS